MNSLTVTSKLAAALFVAGMSFGLPGSSFAEVGTAPSCGPANTLCTWAITVDGKPVEGATGTFGVSESGQIAFEGQEFTLDDGSTAQIDSLSGNIDPVLGFSTSASTTALGKTFAFAFSIPIALQGLINANAEVGYTLTSTTTAGAQIAPLVGGKVVIAQEVDTSVGGLAPLNKGVDVGNTFFFVGGPDQQTSDQPPASSSFVGNLAYDLMAVTVAFSLSPNSNVGVSGFVQQTPVPEPSTYGMLAAGLLLVGWVMRRRLS
jgi:hypothetical protein